MNISNPNVETLYNSNLDSFSERLLHKFLILAYITATFVFDYWTGPSVPFFVYYLIGIGLAIRYTGARFAWFICLISLLLRLYIVNNVPFVIPNQMHLAIYNVHSVLAFVIPTGIMSIVAKQFSDLQRLSNQDPLTGVLNTLAFSNSVTTELVKAHRYNRWLSLAFIDIDDFRAINTKFGHPAGDKVLKAVAKALSKAVRQIDSIARVGGDEFCILLNEVEPSQVQLIIDRINLELERVSLSIEKYTVTCSIGVICFRSTQQRGKMLTASYLIELADAEMYRIKKSRKNGVSIKVIEL